MAGFAGLDAKKKYRVATDGKTLLYLRADGKWVPTTLAREQQATGVAPAGGLPSQPGTATPGAGGGAVSAPPDAAYEATLEGARQTRANQLGSLTQQRTAGLLDYGFTEGPGGPAFDPNNPRSKAALLKQTYDTSRRVAGQQMASTGGLYAGAYQNRQDLINREQLGAEDTLQKSLARFLAENTGAQTRASTDFTNTERTAGAESAARAADSPLYEPTPQAAPAVPAAATKATASVGMPQKTVGGQRFYQRASDKKWIPF